MSVNRYAPAERLVALGLYLSEARGGRTVTEMANHLNVSRRTVERLRASLDRVMGDSLLDRLDEDGQKRWLMPTASFSAFATPTLEELSALKLAAMRYHHSGESADADALDGLAAKLDAFLPRAKMRKFEPDIELILEATGMLSRPGPKIDVNSAITQQIRRAMLGARQVRLKYRRRDLRRLSRPRLHPYGILAGSRGYLVGFNSHPAVREFRLYALSNIDEVEILDYSFERINDFDLKDFAARSFGVFWDGKAFDVAWRFQREVAEDVLSFSFHPNQKIEEMTDGSVIVRFKSSGLTEMAWHLFTWADHVEILEPEELKRRYRELIDAAGSRSL